MRSFAVLLLLAAACGDDDAQGTPDASDTPLAPGCEEPTGEGTEHQGVIDADETWAAADSPHHVVAGVSVTSGTLTIEPCAVVQIDKGLSINVGGTAGADDAAVVAHGESIDNEGAPPTRRPVTFERAVDDEPWGSIVAGETGMLDLELVVLRGGADPDTAAGVGGTLYVLGAGGNSGLTRNLRTVDVAVEGSGGFGVSLEARAAFTDDSDALVIEGAGSLESVTSIDARYPIYVQGAALSSIPSGTYTGNAIDEILVASAQSLLDPAITFHDRGVPYQLEDGFSMAPMDTIADGGLSVLTIEAGVHILFDDEVAMTLGTSNGALPENIWPVRLIAEGTEADPIVITSSDPSPAPGSWLGVYWSGGPSDGNVMSHVEVSYAGGDGGTQGFGCGPADNDAALIITSWRPDDVFITGSTFAHSAAGGIVSGWSSDEAGPDLTSDNSFVDIAGACEVSRWADGDASCPGDPPLCL